MQRSDDSHPTHFAPETDTVVLMAQHLTLSIPSNAILALTDTILHTMYARVHSRLIKGFITRKRNMIRR